MTAKEILTRLQEKYNRGYLPYHTSSKLVQSYDLLWLFEQAERAQELEKIKESHIEELGYVDERLLEAEHQNKRYREAIERAFNEFKYGDAFNAELILVEALEDKQ